MGQSLTAGAALVFIPACLMDPEKKGLNNYELQHTK